MQLVLELVWFISALNSYHICAVYSAVVWLHFNFLLHFFATLFVRCAHKYAIETFLTFLIAFFVQCHKYLSLFCAASASASAGAAVERFLCRNTRLYILLTFLALNNIVMASSCLRRELVLSLAVVGAIAIYRETLDKKGKCRVVSQIDGNFQ